MREPTIHSLMHRLDRLERANRRFKLVGFGVVILIATTMLMGQAKPSNFAPVVDAREFLLRDQSGRIRVRLGMGDVLRAAKGKVEFWPGRDQTDNASIQLFDKEGAPRVAIDLLENTPALYLKGRDGIARAWLEVSGDSPRLVFRDAQQNQRVVLGSFTLYSKTKDGSQYVDLKGEGEYRATSSLVLAGEDGKVLWKIP
ncbi:MAG: hypothetical protein A3F90_18070 [Deltaproteobacteria bacterium RIFCSPLOWO2_12_FULL_60_19]|nr:MAG: hypothetical protein A3F90_18070 [Deltaproteobacteria bacterium RIFCSPLOWO2_12_FULL_60_19]